MTTFDQAQEIICSKFKAILHSKTDHAERPTIIYAFPNFGDYQLAIRANKKKLTLYINAISATGVSIERSLPAEATIEEHYPNKQGKNPPNSLLDAKVAIHLAPSRNRLLRVSLPVDALERLMATYVGVSTSDIGPATTTSSEVKAASLNAANEDEDSFSNDFTLNGGPVDERVLQEVLARRGQPTFRSDLLNLYAKRCCITNCGVVELLEAAHIDQHSEGGDYSVTNGLLLRADIHTLFDLHLLTIDDHLLVQLSERLVGSEYETLQGKQMAAPGSAVAPNMEALRRHFEVFLSCEKARKV
jgi:hypothetical protein